MGATTTTALAVLAVTLMVVAMGAMAAGELSIAGVCFLSASIVIYLRGTRA